MAKFLSLGGKHITEFIFNHKKIHFHFKQMKNNVPKARKDIVPTAQKMLEMYFFYQYVALTGKRGAI